jgi:hypothetical protein
MKPDQTVWSLLLLLHLTICVAPNQHGPQRSLLKPDALIQFLSHQSLSRLMLATTVQFFFSLQRWQSRGRCGKLSDELRPSPTPEPRGSTAWRHAVPFKQRAYGSMFQLPTCNKFLRQNSGLANASSSSWAGTDSLKPATAHFSGCLGISSLSKSGQTITFTSR